MSESDLKLYTELAGWWPLFSIPADYAEEAEIYRQAIRAHCPAAKTLLELGSGGGNNASHLKQTFDMTLVDRSPGMQAVSRQLNPQCEHIPGDMRSVRLGRLFDGVFVHDAVCYMTTPEDLRSVMETAFIHCRAGGCALFVPDCTRENFAPGTSHGGHDDPASLRGIRYLEWTWDPDPADSTYIVDFAYLLRDADGSVRSMQERHTLGLFSRQEWLDLLREVGFTPLALPYPHSDFAVPHEIFMGMK